MTRPRSGLVAVLFSDLVGSTELLSQLDDRAFDDPRRPASRRPWLARIRLPWGRRLFSSQALISGREVDTQKERVMSADESKKTVRRFVEEVQNHHDLEAIDRLVHPDFTDHSGIMPPELPHGRDGLRRFFAVMFDAFPDMHFTIEDQIAENDTVVTRKTLRGSHKGDFFGLASTGNTVEVNVIDILTIVNGQLRDHWGGFDRLSMLQQLGVISV